VHDSAAKTRTASAVKTGRQEECAAAQAEAGKLTEHELIEE
jgi:hypothetical protein